MRSPIKAGFGAVIVSVTFVTAAAAAAVQPALVAPIPDASFQDVAPADMPSVLRPDEAAVIPVPGLLSPDQVPLDGAGAAERIARPLAPLPTPAPAPAAAETARTLLLTPSPAPPTLWHADPSVSWYGPGFYGHRTACGLAMTEDLVGVAHRSLPCGTLVAFRYEGRLVTAPVVDRGPFVAGRTWDLTAGLAARLGHLFTGPLEWRLG
jgi:hypothetical protein